MSTSRSNSNHLRWALPLGLGLALLACSDTTDDPNTGTGYNPATTPGGTSAGSVGNAAGGVGTASGTATPGGVGTASGTATPGGTGTVTPGGTGTASGTGTVSGTGTASGTGAVSGTATPGGTTSGTATAGGTASGTGGTTAGATGGTTAGTTGGTGGAAGGGLPGSEKFVKCNSKDAANDRTKPCGSFVVESGVELKMGPYGAVMDPNVGKGFEVPGDDAITGLICPGFADLFGADPDATARLLDTSNTTLDLHSVYRPAIWPQGKVPIVTWGNGTCAQPEGYGALLRYVASYGFVVVAPNNRFVGAGVEQAKGLDFMFAANMDPMSPYYQHLDTTKVAAMGHSQGGLGTSMVSSDSRVNTVILFNGGTDAQKPFLALSGDRDVSGQDVSQFSGAVMGSSQSKVAWLFYHMVPGNGNLDGHLTLMLQPERVSPATVAWLKMMLLDDAESKTYFSGTGCKLCGKPTDVEFGQKGF